MPATVLALECHPGGPLVPRPHRLQQSATFQKALANLTATIDAAFQGKIRAGFDTQNTSISIGIVSFDQAEAGIPVWEYHRLSAENVNGTQSINRHSQYLIGSISKAITVCPVPASLALFVRLTHARMPSSCGAALALRTPSQSTSLLWWTKSRRSAGKTSPLEHWPGRSPALFPIVKAFELLSLAMPTANIDADGFSVCTFVSVPNLPI